MLNLIRWFHHSYNRLIDWIFMVTYILIGLAIAYSPPADSLAFITRVFRDIPRGTLGWGFFILPSPLFLIRRALLLQFLGLIPLAFVLSTISWFLLTTPNNSWFVVPVFALTILLSVARYFRLLTAHDL